MTDTTQPSQAAREAAAAWAKSNSRHQQAANIRRGSCDTAPILQAFARFERDTEKRVRESVAERTVPVAWLHTLHMEGGQNYTRLLEDDGRDEDEPERTAFGLPGRDYSEEYTVTSEPLYRAAPESLAGEANVERVLSSWRPDEMTPETAPHWLKELSPEEYAKRRNEENESAILSLEVQKDWLTVAAAMLHCQGAMSSSEYGSYGHSCMIVADALIATRGQIIAALATLERTTDEQ